MPIRVFALLGAALMMSGCLSSRPAPQERDLVVLVHGMGRSPLSMAPLQMSLQRAGYRVLNVGYDSQGPSVAEIGAQLGQEVDAALAEAPVQQVHYVGHSLGTVAIRWHLTHDDPPPNVGRAVLLAPPNQGARSADRLARWVGWALPPIRELGTTGIATDLGLPPGVEVAVIAGDRDGKVTVAETCLEGATHAVVPSRHTFIMMRPRVMGMVQSYLATGVLPLADDATCADELSS